MYIYIYTHTHIYIYMYIYIYIYLLWFYGELWDVRKHEVFKKNLLFFEKILLNNPTNSRKSFNDVACLVLKLLGPIWDI